MEKETLKKLQTLGQKLKDLLMKNTNGVNNDEVKLTIIEIKKLRSYLNKIRKENERTKDTID